ncbi:hypothetical protein [Halorussus sp. AFM4]|uniref:hypothetical protein n=1 Tax=Halorussus sp. AFM4 TaxID=3421651 RepID=UPI003EBBF4E7
MLEYNIQKIIEESQNSIPFLFAVFLVFVPLGIGIQILAILSGKYPLSDISYQTANLVINSILTLSLVYLYYSSGQTQQDQLSALEAQSNNLETQAKAITDLSDIQDQQLEILDYQRKMMEQQYSPNLDYTHMYTDGDNLKLTLTNAGAGIATNIRIEAAIEAFRSDPVDDEYITCVSYPTFSSGESSNLILPDDEEEFNFDVSLTVPTEEGLREMGFEDGLASTDHDALGGRWVRIRLLYQDAGGDQKTLRLVEYSRDLVGNLSLGSILGFEQYGRIPDIHLCDR